MPVPDLPEALPTPVQISVPYPVPEPVQTPDTPTSEPGLPTLPIPVPTATPAPEFPVQELPLRQSTREWNAPNRLEVRTGKKTYRDVVKMVRVVKAGEGGGSSNPTLVSCKSIPSKYKSNPMERCAWTPEVTCPRDLPLYSNYYQ